ncbi:MAG: hypothetical protein LLG08_08560 [Actinomycetia bacterium]|nr:hypothetical protein [Actinomycetes bacterium]
MVRALGDDIAAVCAAKARAELAAADKRVDAPIRWSGSVFPTVVLVKGEPGPAELAGGSALSGADGEAATKALEALGVAGPTWSTVSRPRTPGDATSVGLRLREQICAVDPAVVIALDSTARDDVVAAFGLSVLPFGEPIAVLGVVLLAVDGLEQSLTDEARKRTVWKQLQGLTRAPIRPENEQGALRRPAGASLF